MNTFIDAAGRCATALAAVLLSAAPAAASAPPAGSEDAQIMAGYEVWVNQQMTPDGRPCCDVSDGRPVEARIRNGHWEAYVTKAKWPDLQGDEGWRQVPDAMVVREANPTGWLILWVWQGQVRCFRAPLMF